MSKDEWFSAGRVGGEALGDRGGQARLVDDGEVAGLVTFYHFYAIFITILLAWLSSITYSSRFKRKNSVRDLSNGLGVSSCCCLFSDGSTVNV